MNKANKIYIERLRKDDFVDRSPETNIVFEPMTLQEFANILQNATDKMKNVAGIIIEKQKPNFPKEGAEFMSEMNKLKSQPIECGSPDKK